VGTGQGVDPFNTDASGGEGYLYTTATQFSSRHVLARHLQLILSMGPLEGRSVVDIGCGDGFSTFRFWDEAHPARLAGVDPAENAIKVANSKRGERPIEFRVLDGHRVPYDDASFDVAVIQGVLHHADDPQATIREGLRVARELVVLEPDRQRNVAVTDEHDRRGGREQADVRGLGAQHVFPDRIARARVEELGAVLARLRIQRGQERARSGVQLLARPARGGRRVAVEFLDAELPEDDEVVVPDETQMGALRHDLAAAVRCRPVTDDVAEAPDGVRRGVVDRREHRGEGMLVSVNV